MNKRSRQESSRIRWAYVFIFPQTLFIALFTLYPIVMSYVYSFYDWSGIGPLKKYVGFSNFHSLLLEKQFWQAFRNSFEYMAGVIIILMPLTLLMAILLNQTFLRGRVFYRTLYFLPVVATTAVIGIVMQNIFGNENALVNDVLLALHLVKEPIPWLLQPGTAMLVLILVGAWKFFGMMMVYWLAGLQTIQPELYDAAKVDGAGFMTTLRYIVLPLLVPIGTVILLLSVVNSLHVFDLVKTLTGGGPYFKTEMVDLYIYNYAFASGGIPRIGYASAAGVLFGIAVFLISLILGLLVRLARSNFTKSSATRQIDGGLRG
ncbi:carbohydrate ABC transporter permease [Paenibacillus pectinilyticus]|uniref:carbohydrate ABC transporter permease n=1 Tax=Paenibacillus pectinilyticus TaxID=512399 RepID=UPI000A01B022|nr:sugar ABC transporter permease [Paenibacillus pectinilyticus]